jgi:hypothetical protein
MKQNHNHDNALSATAALVRLVRFEFTDAAAAHLADAENLPLKNVNKQKSKI